MNYQKIYDQIIDRAKQRKLEGYKEKHHIIPKCLGGSNKKENLVELTAREHFICHWLLCRNYPENRGLAKAFNLMCQGKNIKQQRHIPSSRAIEEAKQLDRQARRGTTKTQESIEKRTATRRVRGNYNRTKESVMKGIETRKERGSYKGREFTAEHLNKLAKAHEKLIQQITLKGEVVAVYKSLSNASATTDYNISGISRAATGKSKSYKGFIWKYL